MNNYSNMNYYIPNDFSYADPMNITKDLNSMLEQQINMSMNNKDFPNTVKEQVNPKNNFKFNVCNYNQKATPNDLYDAYNGFIRGNMFPELYNQYKISRPYEVDPNNEEGQLLTYINAYSFAAHELNLYLDNHPDDEQMISLFKQFTKESENAKEEYAKKFGPLVVDQSETYPWAWNKAPWPWENR